mgnify:CR=1 FL=1
MVRELIGSTKTMVLATIILPGKTFEKTELVENTSLKILYKEKNS